MEPYAALTAIDWADQNTTYGLADEVALTHFPWNLLARELSCHDARADRPQTIAQFPVALQQSHI